MSPGALRLARGQDRRARELPGLATAAGITGSDRTDVGLVQEGSAAMHDEIEMGLGRLGVPVRTAGPAADLGGGTSGGRGLACTLVGVADEVGRVRGPHMPARIMRVLDAGVGASS